MISSDEYDKQIEAISLEAATLFYTKFNELMLRHGMAHSHALQNRMFDTYVSSLARDLREAANNDTGVEDAIRFDEEFSKREQAGNDRADQNWKSR